MAFSFSTEAKLADPDKTADAVKYAVHFRLSLVFEFLLPFGNLAVEGKAVLLFRLVLALHEHKFRFGFLLGGDGGCLAAGCLVRLAVAALGILLVLWLFGVLFG